ncbi:methyltransferase domain-containing protein [Natronosporangium hydrolyticum]|uniref:Methyltransferase domain-containing protein n=1 Tax=Natronosporangium hydrolyticum TaxID=2811111 RepID=A0A895YFM9_9ACTN|nr:methyltransferase domain-containing protein [Natronosporangium hydrolyticum]QSB14269.1 methyltransferase domain-containing protein [Natronosporangium hydrolyticum]
MGDPRLSRFVDYDNVADRYRHGRQLSPAALHRWRDAVLAHLPDGPLRVLDVGAGTGFFATAWPRWRPGSSVVAVEPNQAMIRAGPESVRYLRAVAERLPVRSGAFDVVWISTALHHFVDLPRAIAECVRALRPDGRLLIRTFLPGHTRVTWAGAFPGHSKALARFPDLDRLIEVCEPHGWELSHLGAVTEGEYNFAQWADWVEQMRHADTILTALTDAEIATGVAALRAAPARRAPVELSLLVLRYPASAARTRSA